MTERRRLKQGVDYFLPPSTKFSFDPVKLEFHLADEPKIIPVSALRDSYDLTIQADTEYREVNLKEDLLMLPQYFGVLMQTPIMTRQLAELDTAKKDLIFEETVEVMRRVYKTIDPSARLPRQRKGEIDWMIFSARTMKPDGWLNLHTLGSCACLGRVWPSMYFHHSDESLFELSLHNAELPAQSLSLFAGAGTINWLLKEQTSDI